MTKRVRYRIESKVFQALILDLRLEGLAGDADEVSLARKDAVRMAELIEADYDVQNGAGALWLQRRLADREWIGELQERSWKKI